MVKGCGSNFVKIVVIACNFCVAAFGAAIFGFSLYANLNKGFKQQLQDLVPKDGFQVDIDKIKDFSTVIWVLCAFGGLVFFVGFLGCCGAAAENRCLLGIYFIVVLLFTLMELGLTIVILTQRGPMKREITNVITKAYSDDAKSLEAIEKEFSCCGVKGTEIKCIGKEQPGCVDAMWQLVDTGLIWLGVVSILAVFVQIFTLVFTCILCTAISKHDQYTQIA